MRFFVFFLLFAFAEPLKLESIDFSKMAEDLVRGNRISIKEIIEELLKNIQGHRTKDVPTIEIDQKNRFRDITIESDVSNITIDMDDDSLRKINIRNLTVPVSHLKVSGEYHFEEISLFDLVIYGQGDVKIEITDLKIFLSMKADWKSSKGWKIADIDIDTSVKDSLIRLDNLMNGEPMGDFLNFMIDELFKVGIDLLNGFVGQYKTELILVLENIINSILET